MTELYLILETPSEAHLFGAVVTTRENYADAVDEAERLSIRDKKPYCVAHVVGTWHIAMIGSMKYIEAK